jgi:hypothetical protein
MLPQALNRPTQIYRLNELANSPDIQPYVAPGLADIDMAGFFDKPGNIALFFKYGAVIFGELERTEAGATYEMHYLLPCSMTGPEKLDACRSALKIIFTQHGARAIFGKTPRENRAARFMNCALGGRIFGGCVDDSGRKCLVYILERVEWHASQLPSLVDSSHTMRRRAS